MKKVLATIVVMIYFCVSTGFVVCLHYCMDRFDSVQIGSSGDDECNKCGMRTNGGCCRDEVMVIKLNTIHLASQTFTPKFSAPEIQLTTTEFLLTSLKNFNFNNEGIAHSPPLHDQHLRIKNCVFRI